MISVCSSGTAYACVLSGGKEQYYVRQILYRFRRERSSDRCPYCADHLKRCEVCYERKVDTRIALTGVRYFKVGRLLNMLPRFANDFLTILFVKCSFLTFQNDIQNQLRRTAKFSSQWRHYNRTINQNRMLQHKID